MSNNFNEDYLSDSGSQISYDDFNIFLHDVVGDHLSNNVDFEETSLYKSKQINPTLIQGPLQEEDQLILDQIKKFIIHKIKIIFYKNGMMYTLDELNLLLNNTFIYSLLKLNYSTSSNKQIINYIKGYQLFIVYKEKYVFKLEKINDTFLKDLNILLNYMEVDSLNYLPLVQILKPNNRKNNIKLEFTLEYNTLGRLKIDLPDNLKNDYYAKKLQLLFDRYVRAQTKEIALKIQPILFEHIDNVPFDVNYLIRFIFEKSATSSQRVIRLNFKFISDLKNTLKEHLSDNINKLNYRSDGYNYLSYVKILDARITSKILDSDLPPTRRNNHGALSQYHNIQEHKMPKKLIQELHNLQYYSLKSLNDEKNKNQILKHCLTNAIRGCMNENLTDDEKNKLVNINLFLHKKPMYIEKSFLNQVSKILEDNIGLVEYQNHNNKKIVTIYSYKNGKTNSETDKNLSDIENFKYTIALKDFHYFPYKDNISYSPSILELFKDFKNIYNTTMLENSINEKITSRKINLEDIKYILWSDPEKSIISKIRFYKEGEVRKHNSLDFINKMFNLEFMEKMKIDEVKKLIKNKNLSSEFIKYLTEIKENNDNYIDDIDLNHYEESIGKHKKIENYEDDKKFEEAEKYIKENLINNEKIFGKMYEGKSEEDLKKTKDKLLKLILNNLFIPLDYEDIPDKIIIADCESLKVKNKFKRNKNVETEKYINVAYSIGYYIIDKYYLDTCIRKNKEFDEDQIKVIEYVGVQKLLDLNSINKNSYTITDIDDDYKGIVYQYQVLTLKDGKTYNGYLKNNNKFYILNTNCLELFLKDIMSLTEKVVIYFHNMKFDRSLFSGIHELYTVESLEKEGIVYKHTYNYYGKKIILIDSLKVIPNKLSKFSQMFDIKTKKEYMPYKLYTLETLNNPLISLKKLSNLFNESKHKKIEGKTYDEFIKHIKENEIPNILINKNKVNYIDLLAYNSYYLKHDVKLLTLGLVKFSKQLYEFKYTPSDVMNHGLMIAKTIKSLENGKLITSENKEEIRVTVLKCKYELDKLFKLNKERGLNLFHYLTCSSFVEDYLIKKGCYLGVTKITGTLLRFIMKSCFGGQTMLGFNKTSQILTEYFNYGLKKIHAELIKTPEYCNEIKFIVDFMEKMNQKKKEIKNNSNNEKLIIEYKEIKKEFDILDKEFKNKYYLDYVSDYDAIACYASAMYEMDGFIKGKPCKFTQDQLFEINNFKERGIPKYVKLCNYVNFLNDKKLKNHFFVHIKFLGEFKKSQFPLFRENLSKIIIDKKLKNDIEENFQWVNQYSENGMIVDKYMLKAIFEIHRPENFQIISGIYYKNGYNDTIKKVIKEIKEKRDFYKLTDNILEQVYKLFMNSGYGKNLVKPSKESSTFFFGTYDNLNSYILNNNVRSKIYIENTDINSKNENNYRLIKEQNELLHSNYAHIGSSILGCSKIIMNRVTLIADDLNLLINNKDTDSVMTLYKNIKEIMEEYKISYKRDLDGDDFGQFHVDFKMKDCIQVFAIAVNFLNKKEYSMVLEGYNYKTGQIEYQEKFAYKGINHKIILDKAIDVCEEDGIQTDFPVFYLFSQNKQFLVDTAGNDTFKNRYINKATASESLIIAPKVLDLVKYEYTYDRFIDNSEDVKNLTYDQKIEKNLFNLLNQKEKEKLINEYNNTVF